MSVKKRLTLMKNGEMGKLFKRRGRGHEMFCIVEKNNGKFSYRLKESGVLNNHDGFPDEDIIKKTTYVNFYKSFDPYVKTEPAGEEEERDRDFLRPFG